jgi:hypothetical protein
VRPDLLIHHLVAIDAQLRRMRRLAHHVGNSEELRARLTALLDESCRDLHRLMSRIGQEEGLKNGSDLPVVG